MVKYEEFLENLYKRYSGNVKLGLQRMINVLDEMDNPNKKLKGFHVAGTNGKGSTCAILEALSLAHGFTTGLNTSPHLVNYTERFRINGKQLSYEEIYDYYHKWESLFISQEASFFEITTAIAFGLFYERKLDTAIMEVGLGGRLDGTNPFLSTVSAITSISIDHRKTLGDTYEKIAFEKAGIMKENIPVVISKLPAEAMKVMKEHAEDVNTPTYIYNEDYFVSNIKLSENGTTFDYSLPSENIELKNLSVNLLGEHQALNGGVAVTCFILYLRLLKLEFNEQLIREGLQNVSWAGRIQIIDKNPLTIIDGAHNDAGMHFLVESLKRIFPHKRKLFVLGILADKTYDNMLKMVSSIADKVYLCQSHSQRAADVELLASVCDEIGLDYESIPDIQMAYKKAKDDANNNDLIVVGGSLYTISEILGKE